MIAIDPASGCSWGDCGACAAAAFVPAVSIVGHDTDVVVGYAGRLKIADRFLGGRVIIVKSSDSDSHNGYSLIGRGAISSACSSTYWAMTFP
jgi:hypothetical protein